MTTATVDVESLHSRLRGVKAKRIESPRRSRRMPGTLARVVVWQYECGCTAAVSGRTWERVDLCGAHAADFQKRADTAKKIAAVTAVLGATKP